MRPVDKWTVGTNGVVKTYKPYRKAKTVLKNNFGEEPNFYCSYCDRQLPGITIDVEHILPKGLPKYAHLEFEWDNFLLGCKSCNGVKLDSDFNPTDVVLPHSQNTLKCFDFNTDGTVKPINGLSKGDLKQVNATITLLGLDIGEKHPKRKPQDDRFAARREIFAIAKIMLSRYESGIVDYVIDITKVARASGFWAVWMKVFENHIEVQDALIAAFKGTYPNCRTTDIDRT
jgi:uncharacterized protein (TIGR02646 family)